MRFAECKYRKVLIFALEDTNEMKGMRASEINALRVYDKSLHLSNTRTKNVNFPSNASFSLFNKTMRLS